MSKRDGRKRRGLSQDERVLWSTVTRSIAPLREIPAEPDIETEPAIAETPRRAARKPKAIDAPAPAPRAKPAPPPLLTPLSRRMRRASRAASDDIDARLDLHGLTQSAGARARLLRFLRAASAREARLVLVITGKGARGEGAGERGVLKRQVPQWLALPEFRSLVIGFEDAGVRHGGDGRVVCAPAADARLGRTCHGANGRKRRSRRKPKRNAANRRARSRRARRRCVRRSSRQRKTCGPSAISKRDCARRFPAPIRWR